jgi:hypothetical protein
VSHLFRAVARNALGDGDEDLATKLVSHVRKDLSVAIMGGKCQSVESHQLSLIWKTK